MSLTDYSAWPYKSSLGLSTNGNGDNAIIETDVSASNIHQDTLSIIFQVTGTDGVTGKASIWIPIQANNTDIKVSVDTTLTTFTINHNQTDYQILFTYPLSTHTITVTYATIRLQSSFLQQYVLPIAIAAVGILAIILVAIFLVVRKKPAQQTQPWSNEQPPTTPPAPAESPPATPPPTNP
jgi:hypothetical protein